MIAEKQQTLAGQHGRERGGNGLPKKPDPGRGQHTWNINVYNKAKKFHFKLKATRTEPSWKLLKFSVFFRLHQFFLQVNSYSETSTPRLRKQRTLRSKFLKFFQKFNTLPSKKQAIATKKTKKIQDPESKSPVDQQGKLVFEKPVCIGSLLVGALALLLGSICGKDQKGLIIHSSLILLFVALLVKNHVKARMAGTLFMFLTTATAVCAVLFRLDKKYMNYDQGSAASTGCYMKFVRYYFQGFASLLVW